jgi:hypothetical protein
MENAGRLVDGSSEKIIARYSDAGKSMEITRVENRAGDQSVLISLSRFPYMKLRGSPPGEQGEFDLVCLEYLGGSVHGWTEYKLELLGAGVILLDGSPSIKITDDIEPVQISSGRIHRYDTRITGGEALANLRNRRERILSLTEWMSARQNTPKDLELTHFEKYWKPVLFPELSPEKSRPAGWARDGDVYVKTEDIRWNTSYTEREFTEQLALVRDSGTLLRDWEDAVSWIYLEYEWEKIKLELSHETTLTKIK